MVVIAVFSLALAIAPGSHCRVALIALGICLPAMYLRSRGEFLAVTVSVALVVLLLARTLMYSPYPE
jgi:hypothetical protein